MLQRTKAGRINRDHGNKELLRAAGQPEVPPSMNERYGPQIMAAVILGSLLAVAAELLGMPWLLRYLPL